ncbi:MAG: DUF3015 family protein [Syntrophorhabdus sp.]|jgi:hypothetical protein|nr:DUF3015 domain-containing protein [Syntrophorhabdus sp.]HOD77647.1 DUF3015 family protein [Syntrophorhabdus sp.]HOH25804.1 DUF3015 family protein [Syntrophorhabdus sp.]HQG25032.1 DUF3015 family protein [Syntrophorhabdus sp.]HQI95902.1 DUF3015 family protein [Syntrophorhabdus sp.]
MMKKVVTVSLVALAVICLGTAVWADQKNYGCGLGSIAFEGNDGLISQVSAATTNGTFGNQTFGITSGTSNCEQFKTFVSNEKINTFVAENMDSLAKDIARGHGEYLDTFAGLIAVPESQKTAIYASLQANFSKIYTSDSVSYLDVLRNIDSVIASS